MNPPLPHLPRPAPRTGRPRARQRGNVLMVTLLIALLVGFGLASYLQLAGQQNRSTLRSEQWNYAMAISEAGIEEALTHLYHASLANLGSQGWTLSSNAYVKQRSLNDGYYRVAISNVNPPVIYSSGYVFAPLSTNYLPARTVRLTTQSNGMFRRGMVAKGRIDLSGNNIRTDSFDSADPAYSTGGRYDAAKARDHGDVATNSGLINSFVVGNANIYGRAATGPGGSVSVGPNGAVGSAAWQNAGHKGIEPGYVTDDMNVAFPDVAVPFTGGAAVPASGSFGGTNYTYLLGSGNYQLSSLSLSAKNKVLVNGHAVLYVTGNLSLSGQSQILINTNASLNLYVGGASASLSGNGVMNHNANSTNFFYWGLPSNTSLSLSGNAAFTGVIYAPNAAFTLGGGGSSTYDFVGASVTGSVDMNGHFNFHYDENLGRIGPNSGFVIASWNEI